MHRNRKWDMLDQYVNAFNTRNIQSQSYMQITKSPVISKDNRSFAGPKLYMHINSKSDMLRQYGNAFNT